MTSLVFSGGAVNYAGIIFASTFKNVHQSGLSCRMTTMAISPSHKQTSICDTLKGTHILEIFTEKYLSGCFRRKPKGNQRKDREKNTRNDERVSVEERDSFDPDRKRQIQIEIITAAVVPRVTQTGCIQQLPFIALHIDRYVHL